MAAVTNVHTLDTTKCHLLDLPPELRNNIYELVFTPDATQAVELLDAKPPQKDLLMTCRQVCDEARLVYRAAFRKFWQDSRFELTLPMDLDSKQENYEDIEEELRRKMDVYDVHQIRSLRMVQRHGEWNLEAGVWVERSDRTSPAQSMMVPKMYSADLMDLDYDISELETLNFAVVDLTFGEYIQPVQELLKDRRISLGEIIAAIEDSW